MIHRYVAPSTTSKRTLVLLHGTGGDETDLLDIAAWIDPTAGVLALRGDVLEQGQNRFFKRLAPGVFDQVDLTMRTINLQAFLNDASVRYGFDVRQTVLIGYSNGANIAASLLLQTEAPIGGAVLLHPMLPCKAVSNPNRKRVPVFLAASSNDPIAPLKSALELEMELASVGHAVTKRIGTSGHRLTMDSIEEAKTWLASIQ
jgi:phospholipase/carboxylesterase